MTLTMGILESAGGAAVGGLPAGIIPYAWYDADQQTESDLAEIVTLVDRSGNGRDFSRVSTYGPLLKHADINGRNAIRVGQNNIGSYRQTVMSIASSFLESPSAASLFMVLKVVNDPAISSNNDGAPFGRLNSHSGNTHMPYSDSNVYTGFCSSTRRSFNPDWDLRQLHIWGEHSASNDFAIYINGNPVFTDETNIVSSSTDPRYFGTGRSIDDIGNYSGTVAEILFFDAVLTTSNRQKVEGYLAHKWGLTSALDAGHPYKTTPPT